MAPPGELQGGLMSEPEVPEKTPPAREAREKPTLTRTGTKPQDPNLARKAPVLPHPGEGGSEGCRGHRSRAQRKKTLGGARTASDFKCSCFHFFP